MCILIEGCEHMSTPRVYVGSWERVLSTRYNPPIVDSFLSHPTEFNEEFIKVDRKTLFYEL